MNIEADELVHDDLKQLTVFSGHVVVTKGTIVLKGERIELREDPQGFQFGLITPEPGARAFYRQKREGLNEFMEGEAERIEYDGREDKIILVGNAELRRYRNGAVSDEMSGQRIVYENLTDRFSIDGKSAPASTGSAGANGAQTGPKSRVRAVLSPQKSTESKP